MATANTYAGASSHGAAHDVVGVVRTVARRYVEEGVGVQAGGIGLFMLAALPASLLAIVATYGLIATPDDVVAHTERLGDFVPETVASFLRDLLDRVVTTSPGSLSITAIGSVLFAVIAAQRAMSATMGALNRIAHLRERRTRLRRQLAALALALAALALVTIALGALVAMPEVARLLAWDDATWQVVVVARWPAVFLLGAGFLAALYRYAPCRWAMTWRAALIGAAVGSALWLVTSLGLSWWVGAVRNYELVYGAAGSMLIVLLWAYLGALAMLIGGVVAAEARDRDQRARANDRWTD